jgi:hypothetical protein
LCHYIHCIVLKYQVGRDLTASQLGKEKSDTQEPQAIEEEEEKGEVKAEEEEAQEETAPRDEAELEEVSCNAEN